MWAGPFTIILGCTFLPGLEAQADCVSGSEDTLTCTQIVEILLALMKGTKHNTYRGERAREKSKRLKKKKFNGPLEESAPT